MSSEIQFKTNFQIHREMGKSYDGVAISAYLDGEHLGDAGYIDWNEGFYSNNGKETASLRIANNKYGIEVSGKKRKGVGNGLMKKLVKELEEDGYNQLVIFGATGEAKPFYDKAFSELKEQKLITSFTSQERYIGEIRDYFYDVRIQTSN